MIRFSPSRKGRALSGTLAILLATGAPTLAPAQMLPAPMMAEEASAQPSPEGYWLGSLDLGAAKLRLGISLQRAEDGSGWTGALDSIDQGAYGIPLSEVSFRDGRLKVRADALNLSIEGPLAEDGASFEGAFNQGGFEQSIAFERKEGAPKLNRPQMPEPPFAYLAEDVTFRNEKADIALAGTLTLPAGASAENPAPALVLVTGSGAQDRDETIFGHKPFLVLADYLAKRGVAVLRFDDRGVGDSEGDFSKATTFDFAQDALAAVAYLKTRPEIDPKRIGIGGHSEGAIVAPLAAVESEDAAFVVMLAGTAMNGAEILYRQADWLMKANGATEEEVALNREIQERIYAIISEEADDAAASERIKSVYGELREKAASMSEEFRAQVDGGENSTEALLSPWFRFFLTYEPLPTMKKLKVPVLAINGSKDFQVPAENLKLIEQALAESGRKDFKVVELEGLNHLFQKANTGNISEYGQIEETMSPAALEVIGDWLAETTGHKP
jgi:fermentation-respiration switch protein FrsA (DUF1100 family)